MKLSEAIREGAKLRPQHTERGGYFSPSNCNSCVFGAAYEGASGLTAKQFLAQTEVSEFLRENFSLIDIVVLHPVTKENDRLFNVGVELNDKYEWTREQIADWVETIEKENDVVKNQNAG